MPGGQAAQKSRSCDRSHRALNDDFCVFLRGLTASLTCSPAPSRSRTAPTSNRSSKRIISTIDSRALSSCAERTRDASYENLFEVRPIESRTTAAEQVRRPYGRRHKCPDRATEVTVHQRRLPRLSSMYDSFPYLFARRRTISRGSDFEQVIKKTIISTIDSRALPS